MSNIHIYYLINQKLNSALENNNIFISLIDFFNKIIFACSYSISNSFLSKFQAALLINFTDP